VCVAARDRLRRIYAKVAIARTIALASSLLGGHGIARGGTVSIKPLTKAALIGSLAAMTVLPGRQKASEAFEALRAIPA
jgi:hypothetical protein